uniref:EF-hand domain-containing protein n=1 Tax=Pyxicephalus adspersus TaxID=30357 RepID=A0AAV3A084_PYXAD|nr:TPA: hypothetical protein GDO54_003102 [Pyxicephalus adspersus]
MIEMEEERLRMREHVMNEVDVDKDRLINLEEFLRATEKREFLEPDGWEMLEEQQPYTEEELLEFERHIAQTEDELIRKKEELDRQQEELQKQHQHIQAQRQELQQVVQQMEQKKQQSPPSVPEPGAQYQPVVDHVAHIGEVGKSQPLPPGHLPEAAVQHSQPAP